MRWVRSPCRLAADLADEVMADGVADQDGQRRHGQHAACQQPASLGLLLQAPFNVGGQQCKCRIVRAELLIDGARGGRDVVGGAVVQLVSQDDTGTRQLRHFGSGSGRGGDGDVELLL
jgi:hypothetical protein